MINLVQNNMNTVTGRSLRNILLLTSTPTIWHLSPFYIDTVCLYGESDLWREWAITDILEMRAGDLQLPEGWNYRDMEAFLQAACCDLLFFQNPKVLYCRRPNRNLTYVLYCRRTRNKLTTLLYCRRTRKKWQKCSISEGPAGSVTTVLYSWKPNRKVTKEGPAGS